MSSPKPLVWLISGANSGLGLALATYVLERGHKVVATARSLSKLPAELTSEGANSNLKAVALDLGWPETRIQDAAREAWALFGRVDVVANNAGYCLTGPVETLRAEDIRAQFQGNVFGHISLTQALLPLLREQGSGTIFNFSSIAGVAGNPPFGAYNASKAALEAFTESLAKEIAPFNLRAFIVEPGYFPTHFLATAVQTESLSDSQALREVYPQYAGVAKTYSARATSVGDARKLAARIVEVAESAAASRGGKEGAQSGGTNGVGQPESMGVKLKEEWVRIPLGEDCGKRFLAKLELVKANVEGTRAIWESTNVD